MKKLITKSNRLVEKGRMIGMGLLSLALLMSSSFQPATAAMNNGKLSVATGSKADIVVKGKIIDDKTGAPLAGVSVKIKGTTAGSTTDNAGNYTLTAPDNATLVISYIGYTTQELPVNSRATINVNLMSSMSELEEVVVVGYGTVKKKDLTGSVSSISAERLVDKPAFNVGQALQGKVSGVQVINNGGGVPGGNPIMRIRGSNSLSSSNDPLFVVDGVVGVSNALSTLNPEDISSMEVLKDASATAIYGARGANGVVMITTKRGISGKTVVDYNGYVTRGDMTRHVYTLTADQMMYVYEQAVSNANKYSQTGYAASKQFNASQKYGPRVNATTGAATYSDMPYLFKQVTQGDYFIDLQGKDGNYYAPRYNSNWEDIIFNPAVSNSQKIDVRGGNEDIKFSMGLGYTLSDGLMKASFQRRYSGRITGDVKISKWLQLSTQLAYMRSLRTGDDGITRDASEVWPIVPTRYPDSPEFTTKAGRWGANQDFNVGEQWYNVEFKRASILQRNNRNQTTGNIDLTGKITKDLGFKTSFSADLNVTKDNNSSGILYNTSNSAGISQGNSAYWQANAYFNYDKTIGSHTVNAVLGTEVSENLTENVNASNSLFFSDWYSYHNLGVGAATRPTVGSSDGRSSLNSYFARANYSFKGKYLFTATARYDGSSKFGPNYKYGFFPSAGIAWNAYQEDFIKNLTPVLSNLKFRASYGKTGNQDISSNAVFGFASSSNIFLNGATNAGLFPSSVANKDLHWEATAQYDGGVEIGLFKSRLNLDVDYYFKKTTDLLLVVNLPLSTTTGSINQNYGSIENKGWEFSMNTVNFAGQFNWGTTATVAMNRNKITKLGPLGADIKNERGAGSGTNIYRIGEPIGSWYGLTRLGTYSTQEASLAARYAKVPGDLKFTDVNQDGKIDIDADGDVMGSAWPKAVIGFNNTFGYKNFDAAVDIQIVRGSTKAFIHESAEDRQLVSGGLNTTLTAWRPDAQDSQVAQIRPGNSGPYYQSFPDTHMIYDSSFIRGSAATLGYRFSKELVNKIGVQNARVYFTAANFFLITKAAGYDPEGSSLDKGGTDRSNTPGQDKYQYPNPTTMTLGLKLGF